MIKVYIKSDDTVEDGEGRTITRVCEAACAARDGRLSGHLRSALKAHGMHPALREDVLAVLVGEDRTVALT